MSCSLMIAASNLKRSTSSNKRSQSILFVNYLSKNQQYRGKSLHHNPYYNYIPTCNSSSSSISSSALRSSPLSSPLKCLPMSKIKINNKRLFSSSSFIKQQKQRSQQQQEKHQKLEEFKQKRYTFLEAIEKEKELLRTSLSTVSFQAYNDAIYIYSNLYSEEGALRAASLVKEMEELSSSSNNKLKPNRMTYNTLIKAWGNSGVKHAGRKAEEVFEKMIKKSSPSISIEEGGGDTSVKPSIRTMNKVINAYASSGKEDAGMHAERILRSMMNIQNNNIPLPDTTTYNLVIDAYALSGNSKESAIQAENLLNEISSDRDKVSNGILPNVTTMNSVLKSWANSAEPDAGTRCEYILNTKFLQQQPSDDQTKTWLIQPNAITFNTIIHAYAREKNKDSGKNAERILRLMEDTSTTSSSKYSPDVTTYNSVIDAYAQTCSIDGAERADELLTEMEHRLFNTNNATNNNKEQQQSRTIAMNTVMNAWANSSSPNAGSKAEAHLSQMERMYYQQGPTNTNAIFFPKPDKISFHTVMNAFSKQNVHNSGFNAERILRRMWQKSLNIAPDTMSYNIVIDAYSNSILRNSNKNNDSEQAARRAGELLNEMKYLSLTSDDNAQCAPNITTMNSVIKAWCRAKNGRKAEEILRDMESLYYNQTDDASTTTTLTAIRPDLISYSTVMNAYAMEKKYDSGLNAEKVFRQMMTRKHTNHNNTTHQPLLPDTICYTALIDAYAQSSSLEAAIRSETILEEMFAVVNDKSNINAFPNVITLNSVLKAWFNSQVHDSGYRANLLLDKIELQCSGGSSGVNDKGGMKMKYESLLPNLTSYITVMQCYARDRLSGSGTNALKLFQKVKHLSSTKQRSQDLFVNTSLYNNLIEAYASSGSVQAACTADELLHTMEEDTSSTFTHIKPNAATISAVIKAWANSGAYDAGEKAYSILSKQFDKHSTNQCLSRQAFHSALLAYKREKGTKTSGKKADHLLRKMQQIAFLTNNNNTNTNNIILQPNTTTFNLVIACYASHYNDRNSALRAEKILDEMEYQNRTGNFGVKPDLTTFNTVMKSWANCRCVGAGKAAERLLIRIQDLHHQGKIDFLPDVISYNTVLNAYAKEEQVPSSSSSSNDNNSPTSYSSSSKNSNTTGAETFLRTMMDDYSTGKSNIKPDTRSYSIVIDSYANQCSSDAALKADNLLTQMETTGYVTPNAITYTSVMKAWANSGRLDSGTKAEHTLNKLERAVTVRHRKDGGGTTNIHLLPTPISYTTVMQGYIHENNKRTGRNAEGVLRKMIKMSYVYKNLKPNTMHYHTVMEAYNHTKILESPIRCEKLLFEMINYSKLGIVQGKHDMLSSEYYAKPNKDTLNLTLKVWADSGIKSSGLKAERLLLKVISYYKSGIITENPTDHKTFKIIIQAYQHQLNRAEDEEIYTSIIPRLKEIALSLDSLERRRSLGKRHSGGSGSSRGKQT